MANRDNVHKVPPDVLTILHWMDLIQECAKTGDFQEVEVPSASDATIFYLVTLPPWERTEEEIVCECPSYEFRGRCRHQHEALGMVCNWSELDGQVQTAEQKKNWICPECGGKTRLVVIND